MVTKKEEMYKRIENHGNDLIKLFNLSSNTEPIKLCKKLHTLEMQANRLTLDACNTGKSHHVELCKILDKAKKILFPTGINNRELYLAIFVNGDCRGYALKIKSEYCIDKQIYRDMGGYGIIAPDFSNN